MADPLPYQSNGTIDRGADVMRGWPATRLGRRRRKGAVVERHAVEASVDTQPFPSDVRGLPEAQRPTVVEVADGQAIDLEIAPVAKRLRVMR